MKKIFLLFFYLRYPRRGIVFLFLSLLLFPFFLQAQYSTGDGSESSPYEIWTRSDLEYLSNYLGDNGVEKHFKLMDDIDLSESSWIPVGNSVSNSFRGKLHGNNKKILNINIGQENTPVTYEHTGLFGYLSDGAYIDSLHIVGGAMRGGSNNNYTGGIAGFAECSNSTEQDSIFIIGCTNSAEIILGNTFNISQSACGGGITGRANSSNFGKIIIKFCENRGIIRETSPGTAYSGGILGQAYSQNNIEVRNCVNHAVINGGGTSHSFTGGIIGAGDVNSNSYIKLEFCYNAGHVIGKNVTTSEFTGGIVGSVSGGGIAHIKDTYNCSNVTSEGTNSCIGGIIGNIFSGAGPYIIENCYTSGLVESNGSGSMAGGIIGKINNSSTTIKNTISANENINGATAHRIVGNNGNFTLINNYANSEMLINDGIVASDDSGSINGADKSLTELYTQSTYTADLSEWDFNNTWELRSDNVNLPYFKWQSAPVYVNKITKTQIKLNLYRNCDSVQIYRHDTGELLYTINMAPYGNYTYPVSIFDVNISKLDFVCYEPDKSFPSYIVTGKIEYEDGTESFPYEIWARVDLEDLSNYLGDNGVGKHFKLMDDIDLSEAPWIPVGNSTDTPFRGKLHGNNKKIKNMNIGQESTPVVYQYTGLFGCLSDGAYVDSLHIVGGNIRGGSDWNNYTGSVTGYINYTNISALDSICIIACTNSAGLQNEVPVSCYIGGFVGYIKGSGNAKVIINSCLNYADINMSIMTNGSVGGLVGISDVESADGLQIINSANYGNIDIRSISEFNVGIRLGGLIGSVNHQLKIKDSYNFNFIKSEGLYTYAGGIAGNFWSNNTNYTLNIENTYSGGSINCPVADNVSSGGIIGRIEFSGVTIKNSVAVQEFISGSTNTHRIYGLYTVPSPITLENNYANSSMLVNGSTVTSTDTDSQEGADKNLSELYTQSTYTTDLSDWDFSNTWELRDDNVNLPYFKWQSAPVHANEINRIQIGLNLYRNCDSVQIYRHDTEELLYTINSVPQGDYTYPVDISDINISRLIFVSYEPNKNFPSYIVTRKIEYLTGNGTESFPYGIWTRVDLMDLSNYLGNDGVGKHFKLMDDIDLSEAPWVPVGNSTDTPFRGKLHGNNKKIKNMNIGQESTPVTYQYTGLFGCLSDGAYVDSLHIVSGNIKGGSGQDNYTGSVTGYINYTNISALDSICIIACTNSAGLQNEASTRYYLGGLVGNIKGVGSAKIIINSCINYADINVSNIVNGGIGGLIGSADVASVDGAQIINSANYGNIDIRSLNAALSGIRVGGLVGSMAYQLKIKDSYNFNNIISSSSHIYAGGILGDFWNDNINYTLNIENTYSSGSINCFGSNSIASGGIIGRIQSNELIIKNSVAAQEFILGSTNAHRIYGLKTVSSPITLENNYANSSMLVNGSTVTSIDTDSQEGADKNLSELYTQSTYTTDLSDWDFSNTWELRDDNVNLPYFKWQASPVQIEEIYRDSTKMVIYRNNDSLQVYTLSPELLETSLENMQEGEILENIDLSHKNAGDTVIFINYEPGKQMSSYPVKTIILPRPINVIADSKTECYGSEEQILTYTFEPALIPGDNFTGSLERETGNEPGEYRILQGTLEINSNYEIIPFSEGIYTINPIYETPESATICEGDTYDFFGTELTEANTYRHTLQSVEGCDSVIVFTLVIDRIDTSISFDIYGTITANTEGAQYQWLDCNNEYLAIEGETNRSFSPVQSGDYAVEITQNDCTDISECQNVIITEIISNEFENKVKIYPNPTKGNITIDLGEQNENVTIKIYDSAGKQIKSFESSGESIINLEITGFAGIYYVDIIKANGDKVNFKIIKTE